MTNSTSSKRAIISVALSVIVLSITITALLVLGQFNHNESSGPRQAFEQHLMALDDQDWELANTYVSERCQSDLDGAEAAGRELADSGFSFYHSFAVEEVWISEDGTEALLGLDTPSNLSLSGVATMERVNGEWLVSCS